MADHKRPKITLSMEDLEASLDSFMVEPRRASRPGVVAAEATFELNCTSGATCNFKCGPTAYWECGPTSYESTCDTWVNTCYSCGYTCPTCNPDYPEC